MEIFRSVIRDIFNQLLAPVLNLTVDMFSPELCSRASSFRDATSRLVFDVPKKRRKLSALFLMRGDFAQSGDEGSGAFDMPIRRKEGQHRARRIFFRNKKRPHARHIIFHFLH